MAVLLPSSIDGGWGPMKYRFEIMEGKGLWAERAVIYLSYIWVGWFFRWAGGVRFTGLDNIPPDGKVILLPNHISALDVFLLPFAILSKHPHAVVRQAAKEELLRLPVIGWYLKKLRAFSIKRGRADLSGIRAIEDFARKDMVVLYPEGTRSRDGKLGRGNRMVGKIIRTVRPVVIPVAIKGTDRIIPVGKYFPRRGADVEVIFGAPLELSREYEIENIKESSTRIVDRVMQAIASLLEGDRAETPHPAGAVEEAGK